MTVTRAPAFWACSSEARGVWDTCPRVRRVSLCPGAVSCSRSSRIPQTGSSIRGIKRRRTYKHGIMASAVAEKDKIVNTLPNMEHRDLDTSLLQKSQKPRLVLVGSGWATATFLKILQPAVKSHLEVVVVSPRNYFLYTPLLPSTITGLVEERSIVEPMRHLVKDKGHFIEAAVLGVDPDRKVLHCEKTYCAVCAARKKSSGEASDHDHTFELPYDGLVMAVGSVTADFGVPGVKENCWFMKTIDDAHSLRVHLSKRFEQAALPDMSREERKRLLNITVVGGGPTGVEVAAELSDFALEDLPKLFPEVPLEDLSIDLMDPGDHVLRQYSPSVGEYAKKLFNKQHINLSLNKRIVGVEHDCLRVLDMATGEESQVSYGTCVWATGMAPHPLVVDLKSKLPSQPGDSTRQGLLTDGFFRVQGAQSILAVGDCSIFGKHDSSHIVDLIYDEAEKNEAGRMSRKELVRVLLSRAPGFPQLGKLGRAIQGDQVESQAKELFGSDHRKAIEEYHNVMSQEGLDKVGLEKLLKSVDRAVRPLPATAQVARQQATHLAQMINRGLLKFEANEEDMGKHLLIDPKAKPFEYMHLGQLAYLGGDKAVFDLPVGGDRGVLHGLAIGHLWKGMETLMQVSSRNMSMVFFDWVRTKIFGRNMSDV